MVVVCLALTLSTSEVDLLERPSRKKVPCVLRDMQPFSYSDADAVGRYCFWQSLSVNLSAGN